MAGRPPKPTGLLLLTGADRKNPKRLKARAGEPQPPGPIGDPPKKWMEFPPAQDEASRLFAAGKSLNEISELLNIPWQTASALKDANAAYLKANKLLAIWHDCIAMWPWVTFSDRHALEHYCILKFKQDTDSLSGAELTAIRSIRSELGGTGSGRARLGVRSAGGAPAVKAKSGDPRAAFLARRSG